MRSSIPPSPLISSKLFSYFLSSLLSILLFFTSEILFSDEPEENKDFFPGHIEALEAEVQRQLELLNIPSSPWIVHQKASIDDAILDVAIIGGGMSGNALCFALLKEGVSSIKIFDENDCGHEGPWTRYARMQTLRSGKSCLGPACGIPSLTFRAWYEAQFGQEKWEVLKFVPTSLWNEYLCWIRHVLDLPVANNIKLVKITPVDGQLRLTFDKDGTKTVQLARKVVLATGREGGGGFLLPDFAKEIPEHFYSHTGQTFDTESLKNKRVAIIGAGASAFDAAATLLEQGAASVDMIIRREALPETNKFNQFYHPGIAHGFYHLSDQLRCAYFGEALDNGIPPPKAAIERVKGVEQFRIHFNATIQDASCDGISVTLKADLLDLTVDYIIFGTGYQVDFSKRPECSEFASQILLWENCSPEEIQNYPKLGTFPYLGPHFEFLEKEPGSAPYLKNIACFNYAAFLSHGLLGGDISLCSLGASRLAEGIISDLFLEESDRYFGNIKSKCVSTQKDF